jgi:hypothetical protein
MPGCKMLCLGVALLVGILGVALLVGIPGPARAQRGHGHGGGGHPHPHGGGPGPGVLVGIPAFAFPGFGAVGVSPYVPTVLVMGPGGAFMPYGPMLPPPVPQRGPLLPAPPAQVAARWPQDKVSQSRRRRATRLGPSN